MGDETLINVPRFSGKTTLEELTGLETWTLKLGAPLAHTACLYRQERDGHRFDYLWHPKPGATRLFVLFSGDAMRWKNEPPVFQRWKWAPHFPGHCLYVSDPSLFLHPKLGLAWYAGTKDYDPMSAIAETIMSAANERGIAPDRICGYGSSGGGFAALRMLTFLPEASAICINPQTHVAFYENGQANFYLRTCLKVTRQEAQAGAFADRINMRHRPQRLADRRIVYMQNVRDTHHYEDHYLPFCTAQSLTPLEGAALAGKELRTGAEGSFRTILFSDEAGHGRAESPEAFTRAMHEFEDLSGGDLS